MLTPEQASKLYTKICITLSRERPSMLERLHTIFPEYEIDKEGDKIKKYSKLSPRTLEKILDNKPGVENTVKRLIELSDEMQDATALYHWTNEHIGPKVVMGCDKEDFSLFIDMHELQNLCGVTRGR